MTANLDLSQVRSPALRALAERGFVEQVSDIQALDDALADTKVTFYIGYDPTATSLHAGNLVTIMAMRLLQKHGHQPIVLLGGGTARIGDPSGRDEIRKMMTEETIDRNVAAIGRQFGQFLSFEGDNAARVVDNADWLVGKYYIEFLRDIGSHFTVNRMIATKTYRDRLDNELPLSFLEFNYQLLQAYDFLHLFREYQCTVQMGGSDQWGNVIAGVELIRRVESGTAHCLTFPLLTTSDGRKMGKSERGAIWLDREQLSPFDYYQYWVGIDDRDVHKLLMMFTDLDVAEVEELAKAEGAALREVKARLAFEATALAHGREAAEQAKTASKQAFGGGDDWSAVPAVKVPQDPIKLVDLVVHENVKAFSSKRQARERIAGGAVRIDGEVRKDPNFELRAGDFDGATLRLQAGKKYRFRVVLGG
jgi:tyrosyl-tRNA synthetase